MRLTILTILAALVTGAVAAPDAAATPSPANTHRQHNSYLHKLPICGTPQAKHKVYCANPDGLPF